MKRNLILKIVLPAVFVGVIAVAWKTVINHEVASAAEADLETMLMTKTLTVTVSDDGTLILPLSEIANGTVVYPNDNPNPLLPLNGSSITFNIVPSTEKIKKILESAYKEPIDALITYDLVDGFVLHDEIDDYSFDIDALTEDIFDAVINDAGAINAVNRHIPAEKTAESLQSKFESVSWINDYSLSVPMCLEITREDLIDCVDDNFNFDIDRLDLSDMLAAIDDEYTTTGIETPFITNDGNCITVKWKTYGKTVDITTTENEILTMITDHESGVCNPVTHGYDADFSKGYVEISLDAQHVWHYVDGELCCESDCVTGTKDRRDTPTGVFYVSERVPGKYLIGDDYKTWVNYWMRLTNSGVGLHDATWRGKFGGDIYTYNGSHGCINLPYSYAKSLYGELSVGTPAIIY